MNESLIALWNRKEKVFGTVCSKSVAVLSGKCFRTKGSGTIIHKAKYNLFMGVWHGEKRKRERIYAGESYSPYFTSVSFCSLSCAHFLRGLLCVSNTAGK